MFSVLQSFEITLAFKTFSFLESFLPFCGPFHSPDAEITTQLHRKEFLLRRFCIGAHISFFFFFYFGHYCQNLLNTDDKMSLSGDF